MRECHIPARILVTILAAVLLIASFTPYASAKGPASKLGRGAVNLSMGWMEIFSSIEENTRKDGLAGIITGIPVGATKAVARTAAGAYELVTFPVPLPAGYESAVKPDYPVRPLFDRRKKRY